MKPRPLVAVMKLMKSLTLRERCQLADGEGKTHQNFAVKTLSPAVAGALPKGELLVANLRASRTVEDACPYKC